MCEMHELAVEPLARDLLHLEVRVRERQTQQFSTGIAGRADDRNRQTVQHDGSGQGFKTKVQHDGSGQGFKTKVQDEGSTRWFNAMVQRDGSTRWFRTRVQDDGS